MNKTYILLVGQ